MKVQTEVIVQEVKRYVAEDGKVFHNEADCKRHEYLLSRKGLEEKLVKIECCKEVEGRTPIDGAEYMDCHEYYWYRPKTREEADVLEAWYNVCVGICDGEVGNWLCIEVSDDYALPMPISDSIINVKRLFGSLGYDVTITKKEE